MVSLKLRANPLSSVAIRRVKRPIFVLSRNAAPADGYEEDHPYWRKPLDVATVEAIKPPTTAEPLDAPMPFVERFRELAVSLPNQLRVIVAFQPTFANAIPVEGSDAEKRLTMCKRTLASLLNRRPNSAFLDLQLNTPSTRNAANFLDGAHYRDPIAREVELAISRAIR
jgi:hypothetical protein